MEQKKLMKQNNWRPLDIKNFLPGMYYDFKMKDNTIIEGGMFKGGKFGNRYGLPIGKPRFFRYQKFVVQELKI